MNKYILDQSGTPQVCDDIFQWGRWMEGSDDMRKLKCDHPIPGVRVSTVFLGLDYSFGASGPPVLWETMVFGGEHDGYQMRYKSREDALRGHAGAVVMVEGGAL